MLDCRYYCSDNMIRLSDKLRQIDKISMRSESLQNEINQLIEKLDAHGHAYNVAHVLHQDILGAPAARLVPLFQCIVKSLTKLRGNVLICFEHWLPDSLEDIFENLCEKNNTSTRMNLLSLQKGWRTLFSVETLRDIDERLHRLDPKWPYLETAEIPWLLDKADTPIPSMALHETNSLSLEDREPSSPGNPTTELSTDSEIIEAASSVQKSKSSPEQPATSLTSSTVLTTFKFSGKERYKKISTSRFHSLEVHQLTATNKRSSTTAMRVRAF